MWYIFQNAMIRGPQKQCSQVSDIQINKYRYTNTQIQFGSNLNFPTDRINPMPKQTMSVKNENRLKWKNQLKMKIRYFSKRARTHASCVHFSQLIQTFFSVKTDCISGKEKSKKMVFLNLAPLLTAVPYSLCFDVIRRVWHSR